ncbi:MAG: TRAP transporter substrate-binding protein DctP [Minwuiales bacterium]|nr:TRAP transporter substrate-binding protein DctP [Minwuiales bacterium]
MVRQVRRLVCAVGMAAVLGVGATAARAEVKLSLVYPFPDFLVYTKSCKLLADSLNQAGAGKFSVEVKPFNSIGMFQQASAIQKGVVDFTCLPAAFYGRSVPENEAISTSNSGPADVRANGGMKIIDDLHQKYMNMKYLAWVDSGVAFHIYMKEPPTFTSDGMPNLTGVKMRDNPIYGAFFRALQAETHQMKSTEVYPALQKGVVNASAWTSIGVMSLKWDEFLKHRLDPEFYQTDIGLIMNLDKWKSLDPALQEIIQRTAIEHENASRAARQAEVAKEAEELKAKGMTFHDVPNPADYIKLSVDSAYDRMEARLKDSGRPLDWAKQLRTLYQK